MLTAIRQQRTICGQEKLTGTGLHSGKECAIHLKPAPADTGVVFRRRDMPDSPSVAASPGNVVNTTRSLDLGRKGKTLVRMAEHLLAACAGLNIDNLLVEMEGPEIPAGDGSAQEIVEVMQTAGSKEQSSKLIAYQPQEKIGCHQQEDYLLLLPAEEISYHYQLDYGDRPPGRKLISFFPGEENFPEDVAPARTFVLKKEIPALREAGLALGGSRDNAVVFSRSGPESELRFPDEAARHKLLDLMGDLFLAGPILGRIIAVRSGHNLNQQLVSSLHRKRKEDTHARQGR